MFGRARKPAEPQALPPLPEGGAMGMIFTRAAERAPDLIAREALVPPPWRLTDAGGDAIADRLRFLPDGRVLGGEHADAASWALREGRLEIADAGGRVSTILRASEAVRGALRLTGDDAAAQGGAIRRLSPVPDDLRIAATLGSRARTVLVRLCRDGAPAAGEACRLVDDAALRFGTDRIDLVEAGEPAAMFVNKTARAVASLQRLVPAGIEAVVLVGAGRCGFAALLVGELLAVAMPDRAIRTLTLNPLMDLADPGEAPGDDGAAPDPALGPPATDPDALAQADTWFTDIAKARFGLARRQGDIAHTVLFDRANPAAARHAHRAAALDGTVLCGDDPSADEPGAALGLPFEEGARALAGSAHAREALARLLASGG